MDERSSRENFPHPAIAAWRQLCPQDEALRRVEVIVERPRSRVYRLRGTGPNSEAIIAKMSDPSVLSHELETYDRVLRRLNVPVAHCFGMVEHAGTSWLFQADAGEHLEKSNPEHRLLVADLLARIHLAAATVEVDHGFLPSVGPPHHAAQLDAVIERATRALDDAALTSDQSRGLEHLVRECQHLVDQWEMVEDLCAGAPHTLVHGDLKRKNAQVRTQAGVTTVTLIDWARAGWGVPAADLGSVVVDLAPYWQAARSKWGGWTVAKFEQLQAVGKLFLAVVLVEVASRELQGPHLDSVWQYLDPQPIAALTRSVAQKADESLSARRAAV